MDEGAGDAAGDSPTVDAGFTFLGQFIDHDITFDPTSSLERENDPEAIWNFRTPLLELDSVYGSGPVASPFLYAKSAQGGAPEKLLLGRNEKGQPRDLPRNSEGTALLGDPRNDENLIISQFHLAFLEFHNAVIDYLKANGPMKQVCGEAQRLVRWHYQWIIVHEFLPLIVGQDCVDDIVNNGRKYYRWKEEDPFIPVEFAIGAYRFGHSQVRAAYKLNDANPVLRLFPELSRGFVTIPADRVIDWSVYFATAGGRRPNPAKKINAKLAGPLFALPFIKPAPDEPPENASLAVRNLIRGERFGLPAGETVAKAMGAAQLSAEELGLRAALGYTGPTPLWYYILKEAEVQTDGKTLGQVGGRIVGEVLLGLLQGDSKSYLSQEPCWQPSLPAANFGTFSMADLLRFAGVA